MHPFSAVGIWESECLPEDVMEGRPVANLACINPHRHHGALLGFLTFPGHYRRRHGQNEVIIACAEIVNLESGATSSAKSSRAR
jgi:hypothetical protein